MSSSQDFCKALQQRLSNLAGVTYATRQDFHAILPTCTDSRPSTASLLVMPMRSDTLRFGASTALVRPWIQRTGQGKTSSCCLPSCLPSLRPGTGGWFDLGLSVLSVFLWFY